MSLVLTCGDAGAFAHLDAQFLPSLRASGKFDGLVVIVDYGFAEGQKAQLKRQGDVEIVTVRRHPAHVIIPVLRLRDFAMVLGRFAPIERVACWDGGDVFFQGSVAPLFASDTPAAAAEINPRLLRDNATMKRWVGADPFGRWLLTSFAALPVINGGFFYGAVEIVREYCRWAFRQCTTGALATIGGADQWALTWAVHGRIWPFDAHQNETWNYTLCTLAPNLEKGVVLDAAGKRPAVIHKNARSCPHVHWSAP
ncbi:hypothetical protein K8I61_17110 [bacterium]|nr:hypothetical protein [bacterium]